jgi:YHS domain-containing protein/putative intracellular protease/amidase
MSGESKSRRKFMVESTSLITAISAAASGASANSSPDRGTKPALKPLKVPSAPITVAFLISDDFEVIDFAGPWEIFQSVLNPTTKKPAFKLYTVSKTGKPVRASGGLKVIPEYSFDSVTLPNVLVIPAQSDDSEPVLSWLRKAAAHTDVTMSVCTGAFLLARAGILNGLDATTHHGAYKLMQANFPHIRVQEKIRYVDTGRIATSSGLSAGIDLALHVVARYFGEQAASDTAAEVEYAGYGWKNPHDTGDIFDRLKSAKKGRICPVCEMGPIGTDISLLYKGKTYYFCSDGCKQTFKKHPEMFVATKQTP